MLTIYHIRLLIDVCRQMSFEGLLNNERVIIPPLEIDIVLPNEFLGVNNNPAIFVNSGTYKQLKKFHSTWVENRTLVFKKTFLKEDAINIIGAVIHETGHAFNVAAHLPNTEENAYIYEIEVMRKLFATQSPLLFGCSFTDIQSYFKHRLTYYCINRQTNTELNDLIESIINEFQLEEEQQDSPPPPILKSPSFKNNNWPGLFSSPLRDEEQENIDANIAPEQENDESSIADFVSSRLD